ncbi:hypothetical protein AB7M32_004622 [Pseudomonas sp. R151218B TE3479]
MKGRARWSLHNRGVSLDLLGDATHLIRRKAKAWLILLVTWILSGRNVRRAAVVSRRDNNDMYGIDEQLEAIAKGISQNYP